MPVHNGLPFLSTSIESILRQSFTDFELIILDDGSTDGSAEVLQAMGPKRIHAFNYSLPTGRVDFLVARICWLQKLRRLWWRGWTLMT